MSAVDTGSVVTNEGSIATSGDQAVGMMAGEGGLAYNSGTIATTGDYAHGMAGGDDADLAPSGAGDALDEGAAARVADPAGAVSV